MEDFFAKAEQAERYQKQIKERKKRLDHSIQSLIENPDFKRVIKELSVLQDIEDARCFDNALAMSYSNGRRSIMVEIKGLFTSEQWSKLMEFKLNGHTD